MVTTNNETINLTYSTPEKVEYAAEKLIYENDRYKVIDTNNEIEFADISPLIKRKIIIKHNNQNEPKQQ